MKVFMCVCLLLVTAGHFHQSWSQKANYQRAKEAVFSNSQPLNRIDLDEFYNVITDSQAAQTSKILDLTNKITVLTANLSAANTLISRLQVVLTVTSDRLNAERTACNAAILELRSNLTAETNARIRALHEEALLREAQDTSLQRHIFMETVTRTSAIAPLASTAAMNAAIAPLATSASLSAYVTKAELASTLAAYSKTIDKTASINSTLDPNIIMSKFQGILAASYLNKTTLTSTLASYVTNSMLNSAIAPLATTAQLSSYASISALNSAIAPLATTLALNDAIARLNVTSCSSECVTKESMSEFFPTTTQLASNSTFQVFQEAALQYIPSTILPPTVNNQMQTLVSSISSSIVAQASLTVMAGEYVEINAAIPYETNGNDQDVSLVFFTSGPSTLNGYYDLAMPNYPQAVGGPLFGTSAIKTSGGLGVAGQLMMFEATGPYADSNFDSTMERLIGRSIWKAPTAGTYTFVAVICTGGSRSMSINAPWGRTLNDANREFGYSTFFVRNLATSLPWSLAQRPAQFYIPSAPVAPTVTAQMQTLITSISGAIVAQTTLAVNAGDYVKINAQVPYETNGDDHDIELIFYTSGPSTAANYYDLAMPNYPQFVGGPLFGTTSIKTIGGLGAPGQLMMFDSTGPYNDPDFNSTPEQLNGHAIWKAPESGNFTFYAVVTTGHTSRAIRINSVWNLAPITLGYEYGYTYFLVQVQAPKQISFHQSNTNTLYTGLLPPFMTGAMQALSASISTNIVANASLTLSHGQLVKITALFPYETNGNDHDIDLIIFTQGPTTQTRYYDLASVNYVRDARLGTTFGKESIRTIYSGVMLGQLLTYDCNGRYHDANFDSTPENLQMSAVWKAPTSGTHNFYAVITTGGNAAYKFRLNSPWNSLGANANYEYGYSHFQVEILK